MIIWIKLTQTIKTGVTITTGGPNKEKAVQNFLRMRGEPNEVTMTIFYDDKEPVRRTVNVAQTN